MSDYTVFISYSHDSDEHRDRVLRLSERLRADGIDTILDRYLHGAPAEGWPRWMMNGLDTATHVLCVCTETYNRRFRGQETPDKGKGADWEGATITQELYDNARSFPKAVIPVLFELGDEIHIPVPLRSTTYYLLNSEENYGSLYDTILGQGGVEAGNLGELKRKERESSEPLTFDHTWTASSRDDNSGSLTRLRNSGERMMGREKELVTSDETRRENDGDAAAGEPTKTKLYPPVENDPANPSYGMRKDEIEHVIVLVNGIRDIGAWQKKVSEHLVTPGTIVLQMRYDMYPAIRFLFPINLSGGPVKKVIDFLSDVRSEHKNAKISIIAHSFGTYVTLRAMRKDPNIEFWKMIFCGSVADDQTRWPMLKRRIGDGKRSTSDFVLNDCGTGDVWPVIGAAFGWHYGMAGATGFNEGFVTNRFHKANGGGHGLYFDPTFVREKWRPFLIEDAPPGKGDAEQGQDLPWMVKILYYRWIRLICRCLTLLAWLLCALTIAAAITFGLVMLAQNFSSPEPRVRSEDGLLLNDQDFSPLTTPNSATTAIQGLEFTEIQRRYNGAMNRQPRNVEAADEFRLIAKQIQTQLLSLPVDSLTHEQQGLYREIMEVNANSEVLNDVDFRDPWDLVPSWQSVFQKYEKLIESATN